MASEKWITDLTASTPPGDAARRVLAIRLESVRDDLGRALAQGRSEAEPIHHLRVSTRRASAALHLFSQCLPDKVGRNARKRLRGVRRAAGAVRDWDVFVMGLGSVSAANSLRVGYVDMLIGYAAARRDAAYAGLEAAGHNHPFAFDRFLADTLHAVTNPAGLAAVAELARPALMNLIAELERTAARAHPTAEELHAVRLIGKRLRYSLEVFACCFGPAARESLYPAIAELQEMLGKANDSAVAGERLASIGVVVESLYPGEWKRYRAGIGSLRRQHEQREAQQRQKFDAWWQRWREMGGAAALLGDASSMRAA